MKSGDVATPVDTLENEVKRLEKAYAEAISQVDKQQIARDKEAAEDAANKAKKLAEETANKAKKSVTKVSSTKKKKKPKK
tara:strand:+ start:1073 stop:1312 length:240 start_codon:yes stop_codon:yes gene_type:complete